MRYTVLLAESVEKYIEKLDPFEKLKIIRRLEKLENHPHSAGEPRGTFWILKIGRVSPGIQDIGAGRSRQSNCHRTAEIRKIQGFL